MGQIIKGQQRDFSLLIKINKKSGQKKIKVKERFISGLYSIIKEKKYSSIKFSLPYLFPIRDEGIERNYPFLTLYRYKRDNTGSSSWDLLWRLISREKSVQNSSFEISYLFDYNKDSSNNSLNLSLIKGLIAYKNNSNRKSLHLFYLPWGLKWGSSNSNKE